MNRINPIAPSAVRFGDVSGTLFHGSHLQVTVTGEHYDQFKSLCTVPNQFSQGEKDKIGIISIASCQADYKGPSDLGFNKMLLLQPQPLNTALDSPESLRTRFTTFTADSWKKTMAFIAHIPQMKLDASVGTHSGDKLFSKEQLKSFQQKLLLDVVNTATLLLGPDKSVVLLSGLNLSE